MIVLSTVLNFRMGYRFADNGIDGYIYGGIGAAIDGFKALIPFLMTLAWRRGYRNAGLVGVPMFVLFTVFSFSAEVGFASQHRLARAAQRKSGADRYGDLRRQLERAEEGLRRLGPQRPSAAIEQERKAILASQAGHSRHTVNEVSGGCTILRRETNEACARWQAVGTEAANAAQAEDLERRAEGLRTSLNGVTEDAGSEVGDPQAAALAKMLNWFKAAFEGDDIQAGLSVLIALVIEAGSGLGLYLVTVSLDSGGRAELHVTPMVEAAPVKPPLAFTETVADHPEEKLVVAQPMLTAEKVPSLPEKPARQVSRFMKERLEADPDSVAQDTEIYRHYEGWCRANDYVPLLEAAFLKEFAVLAGKAGIEAFRAGGILIYRNVMLV